VADRVLLVGELVDDALPTPPPPPTARVQLAMSESPITAKTSVTRRLAVSAMSPHFLDWSG
jgi:hypothetical protein